MTQPIGVGLGMFCSRTVITAAVLILLLWTPGPASCARAGTSVAGPGSLPDPDILRGIDLLYNQEFNQAEALFLKIISQDNNRPEGYFYLAMVSWSELASGFWSPQVVAQYVDRVDRTISVARKHIEMDGANSYDHLYLGGALGFKARFDLMRGNWVSSFFLSLDAIEALETCARMDPDNKEVLLGLGIFDYYTARFSGVLKFLTYLLVHRGDKDEGLRKLHAAADQAVYSATEAKSMLLHIYLFLEEEVDRARELARELAETYDQNSWYPVLLGVCEIRLGRHQAYLRSVEQLLGRSRAARTPVEAAIWKRRAQYLQATHHLFHGDYDRARGVLARILSRADPRSDPRMVAWPMMKIGMSFDLEGDRQKAMGYYREVLEMKNGAGAQFLAEKLLQTPPAANDPFLGY